MGLGSFLKKILDPGDLLGGLSGSTGRDAAEQAAEITSTELRRQFALTQENLRPALEAAQRTLPGLSSQLSSRGISRSLTSLRPKLEDFLAPVREGRGVAGANILESAGITLGAGGIEDISQIDPATMADLLLGAEADLFGRRLSLAGLGEGAGTTLSELGQRTGSGIAQSNIEAQLAGQQAQAAGTSNVIGLLGLGAAALSDERLKEDIEELGKFKGLRIIRWKWRDFVPDSWKDINVGFSAQDVFSQYPEFARIKHGFLAIDRQGLMNHLGMNHGTH